MRRMVTDGSQMFRVVVEQYERKKNPKYVQGGQEPYWLLTDKISEVQYGPYNSLGTAKGVLTRETINTWDDGKLKWGVAGGRIEKATTVWEKVEL